MDPKDLNLNDLSDQEVDERISDIKNRLGDRIFIPVHHYQKDEIVQFADVTGDSLQLSRVSAKTNAEFIVFCGVYFMAEIARVLASKEKHVFIPVKSAGCPLADYARAGQVEKVWSYIKSYDYIPITYANSHASIKAFCGKNGGLVCTSSNAKKLFEWVLNRGKRVFFIPDTNLGINTAEAVGVKDYEIVDYDKMDKIAGKKPDILIWDGNCPIHIIFTTKMVKLWREREPEAKIIVHPESIPEVVRASDMSGSTAGIKKAVEESPAGSRWVIGTEFNFVNRLKNENPDKFVAPLEVSICENMSKNRRKDLLKILTRIEEGDYSDEITVSEDVAVNALRAIDRMLELS